MENWKILKKGKRTDFIAITIITAIFLLVIALNVRLVFRMISDQSEEIGQMQLEIIRGDLQGVISTAENTIVQVALESEQLLQANTPLDELTNFFYQKTDEQKNLTGGVCFNVYIANKEWAIIPNFDMPPEYHAAERLWYKGAVANDGRIYITEPYIDAMTGEMCFTVSKMLPDKNNVVAIDFYLSDVQKSILQMSTTSDRHALIVTKSGLIIGYNDMSLAGKKISEKLPAYEGILSRVIQTERHESFTAQLDGVEHTIFSSKTLNGWYMILSVDNETFYRESYAQIIFTILLSFAMMATIIFFYLNAMKNGLQAEDALHVKEEFLSRLSGELRDPVKRILHLSSVEILKSDANPAEMAAQVRESALKLSAMLDNLFSFSTIVFDKDKVAKDKNFKDAGLSKVSRYARTGVITVVIAAMILAFGICLHATISWGDTKMHREVDTYDHQLENWLEKQRSILSMFSNTIAENPALMEDYPAAVKFLDDIAKHYPEISVCYLSNPYKEHVIIMNNGWQPPPEFEPENRPWYIETEKSESGFSISTPYYDAQTGVYCITLAQMVYGAKGEFIGIFAIDFYLDRLIQVLGESYTKTGYAFLIDRNGIIVNHPNANYQLSKSQMTEITGTEYAAVYGSSEVSRVKDYTNSAVACLAKKNKTSDFTVVVANDWWNIYGNIIILGVFFIILLGISILAVDTLINRLLRWQESVNRQLKLASDTAVAASAAKSQFLAQMSHEIRTPINAVLGMNEMILRECKDKEILEYAANIQSAGRTLLTLINSILDFSKIEDGKMKIIPVRYDTAALIDDLSNMISERAKNKGLQFKTEIAPNLPKSLYGDDVRLRQIITNILTNAVKYTHAGSVTLKISGAELDAETFELQVEISDTGIGIKPEDLSKLAISFTRLDEEKNRNIEGTGLGITIVQKLLAMMNSTLKVESVYGKGSTFSFKLTQKIIDKNSIGSYEELRLKHSYAVAQDKFLLAEGAKVLAVDDNDMNLKVISGLLKRNKIVPDLADSGQQCLEMAKKNFYHIIFLDNMMPIMNGIETLKAMRREKILSDKTAVIMLTASAITGMREMYLREGFTDYLSKPINVSELETMLEKYLPPEIVKFKVEDAAKTEVTSSNIDEKTAESLKNAPSASSAINELTTEIKPPKIENTAEIEEVGEDSFSKSERETFSKICPDINLDTALAYCMESKSFLLELFNTFIDEKRAAKIQAAFDSSDIKNYQILVHALKSTSLSIGAENLSALAKKLELAAKENELTTIQAEHSTLMQLYQRVRIELAQYLEGI